MGLSYLRGDIFLAGTQAIGLGLNQRGRLGVSPLHTTLLDRFPVFVSEFAKRGRAQLLAPGAIWVWKEGQPWLVGLTVRNAPQGITRLRHIEAALLKLAQNWEQEGLHNLALASLAGEEDRQAVRVLLDHYLGPLALPVQFFEEFIPGQPPEPFPASPGASSDNPPGNGQPSC